MKKVNPVKWKRFKESQEGVEAIQLFDKAFKGELSTEELVNLAEKYNPEYFRNLGKERDNIISNIHYFRNLIASYIVDNTPLMETAEDLDDIYVQICFEFILENFNEDIKKDYEKRGEQIPENLSLSDIPEKYYKVLLSHNLSMTLAFYSLGIDNYIPNFFVMQFALLKRFVDNYEIDLPEVPHRAEYCSRCLYYLYICGSLIDFFIDSGIEDMAEISAYLFAYEFPEIKGELESDQRPMPEKPEQVWLLVGNLRGDEKNMKRGFWQGNPMTKRGDLCLFYEKSPIKALNAAWIAQEDGVIDPFFLYYSNTYIGQRIEFPGISFNEFMTNDYFNNLRVDSEGKDLPGNYVKKHFQDCSGWAVSSKDYSEIKRILSAKGFDVSTLPQLPEYEVLQGVNIKVESDVTEQILMPILDQMGYIFKKDYFREVEFTAGHGQTGYGLDKRPDVCLHLTGFGKNVGAQVVIEMKLDMSTPKKLEEAFSQGLSYAKYGEARIYCLADQAGIYVFQRDKFGKFNSKKNDYFKWEHLTEVDNFVKLKRLFEKQ